MSAIIVPSSVLQCRRADRRKATTLSEISALQLNLASIDRSLRSTQDGLNRVSVELDQAIARLHYSQLFTTRCQEIMATGDLSAMISMRDSLLRSALANEVLDSQFRSHQLALVAATAG